MIADFTRTILAAGVTTLLLAFASLMVAIVLGLIAAYCKLSRSFLLRACAQIYTFVVRGIPDLVVILLVYYSVPAVLNQLGDNAGFEVRVEFSPLFAGVATLGLIFGAYMTETFKTALINIPKGQIEAAVAYGLRPRRVFTHIVLPQMIRLALPGFTNNWLVLVKATALVSLIGLQDVMFRAKGAAEATGKPFTFYLIAAGFYLVVTIISMLILAMIARRFERGIREITS
ncbi:ABC transporter permease [Phyllobacterium endophyticum]|uniref:Amino acid ABC transporter permease n=1 Tax=Phyllobacterium endophyticum TaxID=1149773 RepID=A0A2P7ARL6_9HYPH|nr:ABC transporter permease subunit [Phyllobacterium endophyticum]MBB3237484.1 His/Glu/Gln/Arg/opine family amino acid ABC transporter permease subunit [Phyllobacterium endophyticum]PSH56807.1 amino acid ABC transporter permease [Phyllobacterium endophyticum]TYR44209.1 ABC transporter permease subunit [Phyllobacterium endophyticum]